MSERRTLADIGEAGLLALLRPTLESGTLGFPLGSGDDCAVTAGDPRRLVWTIDSMQEGVHFRWWAENTPELLARKLAAVNLSDLASKGAFPQYAMLSLGMPGSAAVDDVCAFMRALVEALEAEGAVLVGGDTISAPQWSLTLSLAGVLPDGQAIPKRANARIRHHVYVTGWPGESAAGLALLEQHPKLPRTTHRRLAITRHLEPTARLAEGAALASAFGDLAMMDVSDGVAHSCAEIARQSGVAIELEEAALPISDSLRACATDLGEEALDLLLYGGEDYELLFTTATPPERVHEVLGANVAHRIGAVVDGGGCRLRRADGTVVPLGPRGFEHFRGES